MALAHPIFVPVYTSGTPMTILKVVQGGSSTIAGNENANSSSTLPAHYSKNAFVWNGNVYFPVGHTDSTNQGWAMFNPRTGQFQTANMQLNSSHLIPIGDRIGVLHASWFMSGPSPRYVDDPGGSGTGFTASEWAALGDLVLVQANASNTIVWAYPFTSPPSMTSGTILNKLCAYRGYIYGLYLSTSGLRLARYNGGWVWVAATQPIPDQYDLQNYATEAAFFEVGDKLWVLVSYDTGSATQWHRLFEVDEVAGTFTEQNGLVPVGWKVAPSHNNRQAFDVIDDTGGTRLVYLFAHNGLTGGWDCYEFDGVNPMTAVANGGHRLGLNAGVIWDEGATGCHVEQSFDSSPSEYATAKHRVYDLAANGPVDVDLRYEDLSDPSSRPVFPQCSEKTGVGSEGTTGLISKPAGISVLADLDDDFVDGVIDPSLWEPVNPSIREAAKEYGSVWTQSNRVFYPLTEVGGEILFGGSSPTPVVQAYTGVGIKSRWGITGPFSVQAIITKLADLLTNTSRYYKLLFMVKEATNQGYGIFFWKNGTVFAKAFAMSPNGNISVGADGATSIVDGMVMEIARDALGNFTMTVDVLGTPEVLPAPPVSPLYTGEVQVWLGAVTETTTPWTGSALGPGFSNFAVSGAGGVGLFEGGVLHDFMWDHVLDLGVGQNTAAVIHADTD